MHKIFEPILNNNIFSLPWTIVHCKKGKFGQIWKKQYLQNQEGHPNFYANFLILHLPNFFKQLTDFLLHVQTLSEWHWLTFYCCESTNQLSVDMHGNLHYTLYLIKNWTYFQSFLYLMCIGFIHYKHNLLITATSSPENCTQVIIEIISCVFIMNLERERERGAKRKRKKKYIQYIYIGYRGEYYFKMEYRESINTSHKSWQSHLTSPTDANQQVTLKGCGQ